MSEQGYVWPVTQNGPVSLQLTEISLALQYAHRNPGILSMERLARDIDRVREMAQRQEECLDAIVGEAATLERVTAAIERAQHKAPELAL